MNRAVLFSDLDRTLVFPRRLLLAGEDAPIVEIHKGQGITVASPATIEALRSLAEAKAFVPVTTRSRSQLERITPVWELASQRWAICANGATVLRHGVEDKRFRAMVDIVCASCAPIEQVRQVIEREVGSPEKVDWMEWIKDCDGRFLYAKLWKKKAPADVEAVASAALAPLGWWSVLHGRKLYAMPGELCKSLAVEYVRDRLEIRELLAAGDSKLDIRFMRIADRAWVPRDAELVAFGKVPEGAIVTRAGHVHAGEEIATSALARVREGRSRKAAKRGRKARA